MHPLYVVFFFSGATSLVWETLWGRELHLVFGTSQFAIATVLAAFMAGLALGGHLGSRFAVNLRRPLRAYAVLELVIGLYALAFPGLLKLIEPIYLGFYRSVSPDPVGFGVFQFVLVGLALLVPAACMGATLPVLTPIGARLASGTGDAIGRLYAANTFGAVAGVATAGFFLLPELGVFATTLLTAGANVLLAGVAWLYDRSGALAHTEAETPDVAPVGAALPPLAPSLLLVAALAGVSSLTLEVAWFRLLSLVLGASVYAFSVMLLAFLIGIAAGGAAGGPLADRLGDRAVRGLIVLQLGVAALSYASMYAYGWLPVVFAKLFFLIRDAKVPELLWPMKCLVGMLVMSPPAVLMGATFPVLVRAARRGADPVAVGRIYAANTAGCLVGAFVGGFVLLPSLQVTGTVLTALGVNVLAAGVATWLAGYRRAVRYLTPVAVLLALVLWSRPPPWNPMLMTSGVYKYVDNLDEPTFAAMKRRMIDRYRLMFYQEGLSTVITVATNRVTGNVWLANNGKIDASSTADMPTQVLVAHLPFLHTGGDARRVMLIGLASGITLGALTLHPELERIDVVELEPTMPDAARLFRPWNHDALNDPRVRIYGNDGRNEVLLAEEGSYDLIVSEPSNPWLTGVSNLFTREFFELGRSRLRPGGIWSQWVQLYGMDGRDLRSILRTFCDVYPYVSVWATIEDADLVMLGSERPIGPDGPLAEAFAHKNIGVEAELLAVAVRDASDVLALSLFGRDTALRVAREAPFNTDDNLLVEYSAPRHLHHGTAWDNMLMLQKEAEVPYAAIPDADGLIRLAQSYAWRGDLVRALKALKEAERREPGREDTGDLYVRYQKMLKEELFSKPGER